MDDTQLSFILLAYLLHCRKPKNIRQTSCGCTNQNRNDQGLVYFKTVTKRVRNKF
jgi:hypothetical protein